MSINRVLNVDSCTLLCRAGGGACPTGQCYALFHLFLYVCKLYKPSIEFAQLAARDAHVRSRGRCCLEADLQRLAV